MVVYRVPVLLEVINSGSFPIMNQNMVVIGHLIGCFEGNCFTELTYMFVVVS